MVVRRASPPCVSSNTRSTGVNQFHLKLVNRRKRPRILHTRGFEAIWRVQYAKIHVNAIQRTAHVARTALAALQSWVALAAIGVKTVVHVDPIASVAMGAVERLNVKMMI